MEIWSDLGKFTRLLRVNNWSILVGVFIILSISKMESLFRPVLAEINIWKLEHSTFLFQQNISLALIYK